MFPNEIINEQYKVNKYFIDLIFPVHKVGIEIDENGHIIDVRLKNKKDKI